MKVTVFDIKGAKVSEMNLPAFFDLEVDAKFLSAVVVAEANNARETLAHTKIRSEIRGGGIKPWKQKGTGRARAGTIRSPLWRKGGVVFGPRKNRNYKTKTNKKALRRAVAMAFAAHKNAVAVLKDVAIEPKTKIASALTTKIAKGKKQLIVTKQSAENLKKAVRNLPSVHTLPVSGLTLHDILDAHTLVIEEAALAPLESLLKGVK